MADLNTTPPDLTVLSAKADVALSKLGVLDADAERTYSKLVSMEKVQKQHHATLLEKLEEQGNRQELMLKAVQRLATEVLVVRRAVEPGRWERLGIMFAGSMAGGAMVNIAFKLLGIDLPSKLLAILG